MLITLGSPLAIERLRKHLARRRQRFPYEVVGTWIDLCGTGDFVTGFRGLRRFAEALDVFVDTGSGLEPRAAHAATTYLDRPATARALEWLDRRHEAQAPMGPEITRPRSVPRRGPRVRGRRSSIRPSARAGDAAGRPAVAVRPGTRVRHGGVGRKARRAGHSHPILTRLAYDNAVYLKKRLSPGLAVNTLLTAWTMNTVAPFEMRIDEDVRVKALTRWRRSRLSEGVGREDLRVCPRGARRPPRRTDVAPRRAGRRRRRRAYRRSSARARRRSRGTRRRAAIVAGLAVLGPGGLGGWRSWASSAAPEAPRPRRP